MDLINLLACYYVTQAETPPDDVAYLDALDVEIDRAERLLDEDGIAAARGLSECILKLEYGLPF